MELLVHFYQPINIYKTLLQVTLLLMRQKSSHYFVISLYLHFKLNFDGLTEWENIKTKHTKLFRLSYRVDSKDYYFFYRYRDKNCFCGKTLEIVIVAKIHWYYFLISEMCIRKIQFPVFSLQCRIAICIILRKYSILSKLFAFDKKQTPM